MEDYVIEMKDIEKIYPNGVAANKGINFCVKKGEIHALMGENGAGKSTLMKILFGIEQPTSGEIYVNGKKEVLYSPQYAITKGIGMVHQHFMLVPSLTVAENIVLGMAPRKNGCFIDFKKAVALTLESSEKYNLKVEPKAKVVDIPVGMKQKVELLKALVRGAKILILDEPTAVLTTQETQELFKELKHLKQQGYTIIFISHKLREIKTLTDRITIMRDGQMVGVYNTADVSEEEISRLMVGRDVELKMEKNEPDPKHVVLKVRNLTYTNEWHKKMLDEVSFDLRSGQILGVAGVEGNGQRELVNMLFDFGIPDAGTIEVNGNNIIGLNHGQLRKLHISLIPEDRMTYGVAQTATISENLIADRYQEKRLNKGILFDNKNILKESQELIKEYQILTKNHKQQVKMLSGGNIQKVVVAREFSSNPELIIADQPTRGIDVGAAEFIHHKLVDLSRKGCAVLLVSADLNEVMKLSDSLIVFNSGKIVAYFKNLKGLNDVILGEYMLGLRKQSEEEIKEVLYEK